MLRELKWTRFLNSVNFPSFIFCAKKLLLIIPEWFSDFFLTKGNYIFGNAAIISAELVIKKLEVCGVFKLVIQSFCTWTMNKISERF